MHYIENHGPASYSCRFVPQSLQLPWYLDIYSAFSQHLFVYWNFLDFILVLQPSHKNLALFHINKYENDVLIF